MSLQIVVVNFNILYDQYDKIPLDKECCIYINVNEISENNINSKSKKNIGKECVTTNTANKLYANSHINSIKSKNIDDDFIYNKFIELLEFIMSNKNKIIGIIEFNKDGTNYILSKIICLHTYNKISDHFKKFLINNRNYLLTYVFNEYVNYLLHPPSTTSKFMWYSDSDYYFQEILYKVLHDVCRYYKDDGKIIDMCEFYQMIHNNSNYLTKFNKDFMSKIEKYRMYKFETINTKYNYTEIFTIESLANYVSNLEKKDDNKTEKLIKENNEKIYNYIDKKFHQLNDEINNINHRVEYLYENINNNELFKIIDDKFKLLNDRINNLEKENQLLKEKMENNNESFKNMENNNKINELEKKNLELKNIINNMEIENLKRKNEELQKQIREMNYNVYDNKLEIIKTKNIMENKIENLEDVILNNI